MFLKSVACLHHFVECKKKVLHCTTEINSRQKQWTEHDNQVNHSCMGGNIQKQTTKGVIYFLRNRESKYHPKNLFFMLTVTKRPLQEKQTS